MSTLKSAQFVKDGIRQALEMKERLQPLVNSPHLKGLWPEPTVRLDAEGNVEFVQAHAGRPEQSG
jgi:hypothetical protein